MIVHSTTDWHIYISYVNMHDEKQLHVFEVHFLSLKPGRLKHLVSCGK